MPIRGEWGPKSTSLVFVRLSLHNQSNPTGSG